MDLGDSVQDVSRTGPEDGNLSAATVLNDDKPARPLRTQRPFQTLQDIQDIIDKLAAVTQQLRRPASSMRNSVPDPSH